MKRREIRRVVAALLPLLLIGLLCARASAGESWGDWPEGKDPKTIGKRIAVNLIERPTYMVGKNGGLQYPEVCTAYGSMRFADVPPSLLLEAFWLKGAGGGAGSAF